MACISDLTLRPPNKPLHLTAFSRQERRPQSIKQPALGVGLRQPSRYILVTSTIMSQSPKCPKCKKEGTCVHHGDVSPSTRYVDLYTFDCPHCSYQDSTRVDGMITSPHVRTVGKLVLDFISGTKRLPCSATDSAEQPRRPEGLNLSTWWFESEDSNQTWFTPRSSLSSNIATTHLRSCRAGLPVHTLSSHPHSGPFPPLLLSSIR